MENGSLVVPSGRRETVSQFQELLLIMTITPQLLCAGSFVLTFVDQLLIELTEVVEGVEVIRAVSFHD